MRRSVTVSAAIACFAAAVPFTASSPARATTVPAYGTIWTVDTAANSLVAYPPNASGTTAATATISGADTGLSAPSAVAVSAAGNVFAANTGNDSITEYAAGASGDAAPIATISGARTGLDGPSSLVLASGELWVTDPAANLVEAFTAGTRGDELPAETIAGPKTKLDHPIAVTVSNDVDEVSVLNAPTTGAASIASYPTETPGNVAPIAAITSGAGHVLDKPTALFSSGFGTVWVANSGSNSLAEYFLIPGAGISQSIQRISGADTKLDQPDSIAVDALGQFVVSNAGDHTVRTFAPSAHGDATPLRTLAGVGSDTGSPAAATVYGVAPGQPTGLKVTIHGTKAHLSWTAPSVTGGGVVGYVVLKASGALGQSLSEIGFFSGNLGGVYVDTHKTSITQNIKPGHEYYFALAAVNAFGTSEFSTPVRDGILLPPGPPRKVVATTGHGLVLVQWSPPKHTGGAKVRSYRIEYATCVPGAAGCKFRTKVAKASAHYQRLTGLKRGTTYHLRVLAKNRQGLGKPSRVVTATP